MPPCSYLCVRGQGESGRVAVDLVDTVKEKYHPLDVTVVLRRSGTSLDCPHFDSSLCRSESGLLDEFFVSALFYFVH